MLKTTADLLGIGLYLQPQNSHQLKSNYSVCLHAWFLKEIQKYDSDLSKRMHHSQTIKEFTISRFIGLPFNINEKIYVNSQQLYKFQITVFSYKLANWISLWIQNISKELTINSNIFFIENIGITLEAKTYHELWSSEFPKSLSLQFLSPTSFRSRGHHLPLPIPRNLFQSYLRRWNSLGSLYFEIDPFLAWVEQHVIIQDCDISTIRTQGGKRGLVTGFIGKIKLGLSSSALESHEYVALFHALGRYAPYCGTGHKTTFGLGLTIYS